MLQLFDTLNRHLHPLSTALYFSIIFEQTRKFRYHMPDKAHAAADVTRFFGTFAILMGIVLYALVVVIRLRIAYENGDDFIWTGAIGCRCFVDG